RRRYAGRTTLVVGAGHSAANALLALAELAKTEPGTRIVWATRGEDLRRAFGGGKDDGLPARGQLGADLHALVDAGALDLVTDFRARSVETTGDVMSVAGVRAGA